MGLEQRLREGRLARGRSQEQVAKELGVTRQAVTKWENGASLPSSANLLRLSALLEIPLEELTGTPAKREDRWRELAVLAAGFLIGAYSIPRSPCGYDYGWIGPLGGGSAGGV